MSRYGNTMVGTYFLFPRTHTQTDTHTHTYTYIYIYIYILSSHSHIHTQTHHTHTHTQFPPRFPYLLLLLLPPTCTYPPPAYCLPSSFLSVFLTERTAYLSLYFLLRFYRYISHFCIIIIISPIS